MKSSLREFKNRFIPSVIILLLLNSVTAFGQWLEQPFSSSEPLYKVTFADSANGWILGEDHIFKTSDGGITWTPQDSSVGNGSALAVINTDTVLYSKVANTPPFSRLTRRTSDGGVTWQTVDTTYYYADLQFIDNQTGFGGGSSFTGAALRKTTDGGATWSTIWTSDGSYEITGLHFIDHNNAWAVLYNAMIMKTTDGGFNWTMSDTIRPNPNSYLPLEDITFAGADSGWAVGGIAGNSIVVRTTDAGSSWTYDVMKGSSLREVKFFNSKVGWFCGANNFEPFIAKTTDGGETWATQHQVPYAPAGAESFCMIDTSLGWAVNYDGELYKTTNGGITFVEEGNTQNKPESFNLSQNYPNPFNPVTNIKFAVASRQFVSLKVFDLLGKEITTLVNEEKPAGSYQVTWNGSNLPSGIYFYQLKAGSFLSTKKMTLLK